MIKEFYYVILLFRVQDIWENLCYNPGKSRVNLTFLSLCLDLVLR